MNNYYVYAYLRNDGSPYYIGKGKDGRAWSKNHGRIFVPKNKENIQIFFENLPEKDAHLKEIELIAYYGRKDLNTGILQNQTNGGEGSSGRQLSAESIQKLSNTTRKNNESGKTGFGLGHGLSAGKIGGKSKSRKKLAATKNNHLKNEERIRGTKWMVNPFENKKRRIKLEDVEKYLSIGWQLKFQDAWNKGNSYK